MKIQLLSPAGEIHRSRTGIFKTSLRYAPLTLTTLAALVPPELDAEVAIQDEGVQPLDLDFPRSLVGITAITGTAQKSHLWGQPRVASMLLTVAYRSRLSRSRRAIGTPSSRLPVGAKYRGCSRPAAKSRRSCGQDRSA